MERTRGCFEADELVAVPPRENPAVLRSGGPVMNLLGVADGIALCEWRSDDGRVCRGRFPAACLYRCVPVEGGS